MYFPQQNIDNSCKIKVSAKIPIFLEILTAQRQSKCVKEANCWLHKIPREAERKRMGFLQKCFCILSTVESVHIFAESRGDTVLLLFFISIIKINIRGNISIRNQSEKGISS